MDALDFDIKFNTDFSKSFRGVDKEIDKLVNSQDDLIKSLDDVTLGYDEFTKQQKKTDKGIKSFLKSLVAQDKALGKAWDSVKRLAKELIALHVLYDTWKTIAAINEQFTRLSVTLTGSTDAVQTLTSSSRVLETQFGMASDEAAGMISSFAEAGVTVKTIDQMSLSMASFSKATGMSADAVGSLMYDMQTMKMGNDDMNMFLGTMNNFKKEVGFTSQEFNDLTLSMGKTMLNLKKLGANKITIQRTGKEIAKLSAVFKKVGIDANKAASAVDALLNPDNFEQNMQLFAEMGLSFSDQMDIMMGNKSLQDFPEALGRVTSKVQGMGFAGVQYWNQIGGQLGLSYHDAIAMANGGAAALEDANQEMTDAATDSGAGAEASLLQAGEDATSGTLSTIDKMKKNWELAMRDIVQTLQDSGILDLFIDLGKKGGEALTRIAGAFSTLEKKTGAISGIVKGFGSIFKVVADIVVDITDKIANSTHRMGDMTSIGEKIESTFKKVADWIWNAYGKVSEFIATAKDWMDGFGGGWGKALMVAIALGIVLLIKFKTSIKKFFKNIGKDAGGAFRQEVFSSLEEIPGDAKTQGELAGKEFSKGMLKNAQGALTSLQHGTQQAGENASQMQHSGGARQTVGPRTTNTQLMMDTKPAAVKFQGFQLYAENEADKTNSKIAKRLLGYVANTYGTIAKNQATLFNQNKWYVKSFDIANDINGAAKEGIENTITQTMQEKQKAKVLNEQLYAVISGNTEYGKQIKLIDIALQGQDQAEIEANATALGYKNVNEMLKAQGALQEKQDKLAKKINYEIKQEEEAIHKANVQQQIMNNLASPKARAALLLQLNSETKAIEDQIVEQDKLISQHESYSKSRIRYEELMSQDAKNLSTADLDELNALDKQLKYLKAIGDAHNIDFNDTNAGNTLINKRNELLTKGSTLREEEEIIAKQNLVTDDRLKDISKKLVTDLEQEANWKKKGYLERMREKDIAERLRDLGISAITDDDKRLQKMQEILNIDEADYREKIAAAKEMGAGGVGIIRHLEAELNLKQRLIKQESKRAREIEITAKTGMEAEGSLGQRMLRTVRYYSHYDDALDAVKKKFKDIKERGVDAFSAVGDAVKATGKRILNLPRAAWGRLTGRNRREEGGGGTEHLPRSEGGRGRGGLSGVLGGIGKMMGVFGIVAGLFSRMGVDFSSVTDTLQTAMAPIGAALNSLLQNLMPKIMPIIQMLVQTLGDLFTSIGPAIGELVSTIGGLLTSPAIKSLLDSVMNLVKSLLPVLNWVLETFIVPALKIVGDILSVVVDVINGLIDAIFFWCDDEDENQQADTRQQRDLRRNANDVVTALGLTDDQLKENTASMASSLDSLNDFPDRLNKVGQMQHLVDVIGALPAGLNNSQLRSAVGDMTDELKQQFPDLADKLEAGTLTQDDLNKTMQAQTDLEKAKLKTESLQAMVDAAKQLNDAQLRGVQITDELAALAGKTDDASNMQREQLTAEKESLKAQLDLGSLRAQQLAESGMFSQETAQTFEHLASDFDNVNQNFGQMVDNQGIMARWDQTAAQTLTTNQQSDNSANLATLNAIREAAGQAQMGEVEAAHMLQEIAAKGFEAVKAEVTTQTQSQQARQTAAAITNSPTMRANAQQVSQGPLTSQQAWEMQQAQRNARNTVVQPPQTTQAFASGGYVGQTEGLVYLHPDELVVPNASQLQSLPQYEQSFYNPGQQTGAAANVPSVNTQIMDLLATMVEVNSGGVSETTYTQKMDELIEEQKKDAKNAQETLTETNKVLEDVKKLLNDTLNGNLARSIITMLFQIATNTGNAGRAGAVSVTQNNGSFGGF